MIEMFRNSILLFCKGKLFKDLNKVMMLVVFGAVLAALMMVALVKVGVNMWLAVMIASGLSGALQPRLFRDLKFQ
ncbi:MAG: hypothetical protein NPIRA04_32770 [Nitrospirales bacterium]|nr:MAG: hypothetical protein NPIRA04_32770 [Nitrospirales bacterium]